MNRGLLIRLCICLLVFSLCLYKYINRINELTEIKLALPKIEKKILSLKEENSKLKYEIDQFENPKRLMELAKSPEFAHLKHPLVKDILKIEKNSEYSVALDKSILENQEHIDNNSPFAK